MAAPYRQNVPIFEAVSFCESYFTYYEIARIRNNVGLDTRPFSHWFIGSGEADRTVNITFLAPSGLGVPWVSFRLTCPTSGNWYQFDYNPSLVNAFNHSVGPI